MLNANALRASMVENNCSVRELAEICGLKPKAFYQRLNGRVDFRVGEIIKCSGRLHLSVEKRNQIFFCGGSFLKETNARRGNFRADRETGVHTDSRLCKNLFSRP